MCDPFTMLIIMKSISGYFFCYLVKSLFIQACNFWALVIYIFFKSLPITETAQKPGNFEHCRGCVDNYNNYIDLAYV